jgi:hypothetical protein
MKKISMNSTEVKHSSNLMLTAAFAHLTAFFISVCQSLASLTATAKATQDLDFVFQQSCPVLRWAEVAVNYSIAAMQKFA